MYLFNARSNAYWKLGEKVASSAYSMFEIKTGVYSVFEKKSKRSNNSMMFRMTAYSVFGYTRRDN